MVAPPSYIIRRGTTLVFRRRIPAVAKNFFSRAFFSFSLRTHLLSEARRRAAIAARFTDDLIGLIEICGADMLEERQLDTVIDALMRFEIAAAETLRETCGPRGAEAVTAAVRLHEATRDTLRAALVYNEYDAVAAPLARTLAHLGLAAEPGGEDWRRAARRAARALIEVAEDNIRREQGLYRTDDRLAAVTGLAEPGRDALPGSAALALPPVPSQISPAPRDAISGAGPVIAPVAPPARVAEAAQTHLPGQSLPGTVSRQAQTQPALPMAARPAAPPPARISRPPAPAQDRPDANGAGTS